MDRRYVGAAFGMLLALGCNKDPGTTGAGSATAATAAPAVPQLTDTMPSTVSPNRGEPNSGEDPKAEFTELVEVMKASTTAVDRSVLIRGHVERLLGPDQPSVIHECKFRQNRINFLVHYPEDKLPLMRALPTHKPKGECPRIHVKLTGFDKASGDPQGTVIEVYDVRPDPIPTNVPAGVDFISLQDAFLKGSGAVGKVADVSVFFDHKEDKGGVTHYALRGRDCTPHGTWEGHLLVPENDKTKSVLAAIPKRPKCQRVRVKLTAAPTAEAPDRFGAELLGIGAVTSIPEPPPSP